MNNKSKAIVKAILKNDLKSLVDVPVKMLRDCDPTNVKDMDSLIKITEGKIKKALGLKGKWKKPKSKYSSGKTLFLAARKREEKLTDITSPFMKAYAIAIERKMTKNILKALRKRKGE